jgi:hypothetical protein
MGLRDRIQAARTTREVRAALADLIDDPTDTGAHGRAATHRLYQQALRQAEQQQADVRRADRT